MVKTSNPLQRIMDEIKTWARINSPWIIHYNSGSCNGCDIEILATLTPRYDVERFGIKLQGSPRHADVLVCTGPVTLQSRDRLVRIYEQMPEPKFVVAVGSCGLSGGVFRDAITWLGASMRCFRSMYMFLAARHDQKRLFMVWFNYCRD